jgi:hypothetical protein
MPKRILIPGFTFRPAYWLGKLPPWGHQIHAWDHRYLAPEVLVVHSGDHSPDLATYLEDPREPLPPGTDPAHPPSGMLHCLDGHWRRTVATHGAWDERLQQIVQMVGLELESWGTGSSLWQGKVCNRVAVHVELSGPYSQAQRAPAEIAELQRFARGVVACRPTVKHWITHQQIDMHKHDPGPGLPEDWADGILQRG